MDSVGGVGASLQSWYDQISQQQALVGTKKDRSDRGGEASDDDVARYHAYEKEQKWDWFDLPDFSNITFSDSCSCLNPQSGPKQCCERCFRRAHKMGHVLGQNVFTRPIEASHNWRKGLPTGKDYRDVVLVRDFYDSLTSGYLYHKAGHECWLTPDGKKEKEGFNGYHNFDEYILHFLPHEPPKKDRNMCRYMADEEEAVGMRVYMDFIFHNGYQDLLRMWRYQQIPSQRHKIIFVCYSDLTRPGKDLELVEKSLDHFYPNKTAPEVYKKKVLARPPSKRAMNYSGGHATTKDTAVRDRLHALIHQLDKEHFNGMVEWAASLFPSCHGKSSPGSSTA